MSTKGRHHHPISRAHRWTRRVLVSAVAGAVAVAAALAALAPAEPLTTNVATIPTTQAETIFVAELAAAGVPLSSREAQTAVEIARIHVAHGHLIGMRELIRNDFRAAFPELTEEQVEIAKVAVEHHFLAVTGRKQ